MASTLTLVSTTYSVETSLRVLFRSSLTRSIQYGGWFVSRCLFVLSFRKRANPPCKNAPIRLAKTRQSAWQKRANSPGENAPICLVKRQQMHIGRVVAFVLAGQQCERWRRKRRHRIFAICIFRPFAMSSHHIVGLSSFHLADLPRQHEQFPWHQLSTIIQWNLYFHHIL